MSDPAKNPWATTIMGAIGRHVAIPAPPAGSPGLFRCASEGFMSAVFADAGLHNITEEEVSCDLVLTTPHQYWAFMTDIAAPVVSGLAMADETTRERIRVEVLEMVQRTRRNESVRLQSTATVIVGTR